MLDSTAIYEAVYQKFKCWIFISFSKNTKIRQYKITFYMYDTINQFLDIQNEDDIIKHVNFIFLFKNYYF